MVLGDGGRNCKRERVAVRTASGGPVAGMEIFSYAQSSQPSQVQWLLFFMFSAHLLLTQLLTIGFENSLFEHRIVFFFFLFGR
jgi:hypothetical protein